MICIIAMVVFAVLGIFSAKYRSYAAEAFSCVFRRVTLRPCESDFDHRMKMKVISHTFQRSERLGKFVYKHFELISWIFTIIMIVSLAYSAVAAYNLIVYGTCTPGSSDVCTINQLVQSAECAVK